MLMCHNKKIRFSPIKGQKFGPSDAKYLKDKKARHPNNPSHLCKN
jgi:hypothetical protein